MFSEGKAMSTNHPAVLDEAFRVAVDRAKAIFAVQVDDGLQGCAWIEALTGEKDQPVVSLNQYCLEHQVNGLCLTRYTIHLFRENKVRVNVAHNPGAARIFKVVIDSW